MKNNRLFKTLGSAAVKGFLHANPWFEVYLEKLDDEKFAVVVAIIKRSYLGGLNMANFRGDTATYAPLAGYVFVDIDFANAYANGFARCAKLDTDSTPEIVRAEYKWSATAEAELKAENIPDWLRGYARRKAEAGRDAVDQLFRLLRTVKSPDWSDDEDKKHYRKKLQNKKVQRRRKWAKILRDVLLTPNNSHLDRWVEQVNSGTLNYEIPGFACVRFKERPDVQFTSLPIKKRPFGLLYVREGETVVPAVELVMAVNAGAKVEVMWSVELPVERDQDGSAKLIFYRHLKKLVRMRSKAKKNAENSPVDAAREQLLKEMINAFYGKSAQGLNYRRVYNPSTGEYFPLVPSEITEPSVAALVTAQVRAALASTLLAIQEYNRSRPGGVPLWSFRRQPMDF